MSVLIEPAGDSIVVRIQGNIDGATVGPIQQQVLEAAEQVRDVTLDCSDVPYMSSAGFRMLLLLHRGVATRGGKVALVGLLEEVRDTMEMTGFLGFFELADSVEQLAASR